MTELKFLRGVKIHKFILSPACRLCAIIGPTEEKVFSADVDLGNFLSNAHTGN